MGKIRSGITGNIKGDIGNLNGFELSGIGNLRARWSSQKVPNTRLKQSRITKFTKMANVWKLIADPFLREFWYDTHGQARSYHMFLSLNIQFAGSLLSNSLILFEPFLGPLSPPTITDVTAGISQSIRVDYTSPQLLTIQSDRSDTIIFMFFNITKSTTFFKTSTQNRGQTSFVGAPGFFDTGDEIAIKIGFTPNGATSSMSPTAKIKWIAT